MSAVTEVAAGVFRLALPLGIHGVPSLSAYLLADDGGDTLVDCGVAAGGDPLRPLADALADCGSSFDRLARVVVTHAHIDHFGLAGEVVRRSDADLWLHTSAERDLKKYADPEDAVDRRMVMLADHGLYGELLTETSTGLRDWMPVMPSIGRPTRWLRGGESFSAVGRAWHVLHTPGHSAGHVCLWQPRDQLLCSGDHLLKEVSPPVTFERGFDPDPMGSYLDSLRRVRDLEPLLVLPGHGEPFVDGARRALGIERGKLRRLDQVLSLISRRGRTVTELTDDLFSFPLTAPQRHFVMAEILAYLAYHEKRGRAVRRRRADGIFVWTATHASVEVRS